MNLTDNGAKSNPECSARQIASNIPKRGFYLLTTAQLVLVVPLDRRETLASLQPYLQRASQFSGWDFRNVSVHQLGADPPWNYELLVREAAKRATWVLDMGTGGGEFLARVHDGLLGQVVATEEWKVNAPIAKRRLAPFGFEVIECQSRQLPFKQAALDLILNRHEELEPSEIGRVIRPGGRIITQQVDRNNWRELRKHFPRMTDPGDHHGEYARGFQAAGLKLISDLRHERKVAYATLGDFVFMLAVTPWTVPGFNLEDDLDSLISLNEECHTKNGLELTESRFLLIAEKPK